MKPSTRVREGAVVEQRRALRAGRPDHQPAGRAARCCSQRPRIGAESRVETADGEQPWCGHPPQRGDRIERHLLGGRREVDDGRNRPAERRRGDEGGGPTHRGAHQDEPLRPSRTELADSSDDVLVDAKVARVVDELRLAVAAVVEGEHAVTTSRGDAREGQPVAESPPCSCQSAIPTLPLPSTTPASATPSALLNRTEPRRSRGRTRFERR
jgi:hypothetical protein